MYTILNSYFYYALSCRNGDAVDSVIGRMGIMWYTDCYKHEHEST